MDYEKIYKDAFRLAVQMHESGLYNNEVIENLFPKLRGSKEERIVECIHQVMYESTMDTDECFSEYGILRKDVFEWLKKQMQFEGTKDRINVLSHFIHSFVDENTKYTFPVEDGDENVDFTITGKQAIEMLESLRSKNSFNPHNIWSEDDKACLDGVIETELYMLDVVNGNKPFAVGSKSIKEECEKELNWLRNLKINHWKPSEFQMDALEDMAVSATSSITRKALSSLYNDLKKL